MKTKIYVLCEPDGEIRYIGKTSLSLLARLISHFAEARRGDRIERNRLNHRLNWLRSVLSKGYLPKIDLIGEVDGDGCREEIAWIAYGRQEGWRLVNGTDGGEGHLGWSPSEETLRKMSKSSKGHLVSFELREKLSRVHKGKKISIKQREQISASLRNRPKSNEHRKKIGDALRGRSLSEDCKRKLSISHKKYWQLNAGKKRGPYKRSDTTR
jgi:hypothetical protein